MTTTTLTTQICADCTLTFSYPPRRGRPAKYCPECRRKRQEEQAAQQGTTEVRQMARQTSCIDWGEETVQQMEGRGHRQEPHTQSYSPSHRIPRGGECECVKGGSSGGKGCGRFFSSESAFTAHLAPQDAAMTCWDVETMVNKWGKGVFRKVERAGGWTWGLVAYDREGNEVEYRGWGLDWEKTEA